MEAIEFLEILLDQFFHTRLERNGYLSRETGRDIRFLDEVFPSERSRLIAELKERRDRGKSERDDRDED